MKNIIKVIKSISDQNRLRIFLALRERELCVCEITELLQLAPSTVSKHLSLLKAAELILDTKKGKWVYYQLNYELPLTKEVLKFLENISNDKQVLADIKTINSKKMKQVCEINLKVKK